MKKSKRIFTALLLAALLVSALCVPASALTESEVESVIETSGEGAVTGNVLIWFFCALAFLKVSQKIDSLMAALGINVSRPGGSLLAEAMVAMRAVTMVVNGGRRAMAGRAGSASGSTVGESGSAGMSGFFKGGLIGMADRQVTNNAVKTAATQTSAVHTAQSQAYQTTAAAAETASDAHINNEVHTGGTSIHARGVAASRPLPLGRYKIVEVTAPAYWQLSGTVFDVTLEYSGQIIKLSDYDKPSNLGVTITKRGNAEVLAGSQMRYDITVANTSNVALENFYWHDRIPTDAARATVLTTGTYSARLNYRILYKTNYMTAYQVLASNLLTTSSYSFSLNAIPMQAGEYVTDVYFDFGKVPVGFQSVANPTLTVQVLGTVANNYQIINRADVGGKYQGTWQTAQAVWVTIVRKLTPTPTLPKTGY